jgi:hypothetical protein
LKSKIILSFIVCILLTACTFLAVENHNLKDTMSIMEGYNVEYIEQVESVNRQLSAVLSELDLCEKCMERNEDVKETIIVKDDNASQVDNDEPIIVVEDENVLENNLEVLSNLEKTNLFEDIMRDMEKEECLQEDYYD